MKNDTGDRDYYRENEIECIDAIKAALGTEGFISFLRGQVIKYNWRLMSKGKAHEDSIKATWYQNRLTQELKNDQPRPELFLKVNPALDETIRRTDSGDIVCKHCYAKLGDVHAPDCLVYKDPSHPRGSAGR